jgi:hypothetical protein
MSEAAVVRLLNEHALACWISEDSAACQIFFDAIGEKSRALYYRTRTVVLYDRCRDRIEGQPRLLMGDALNQEPRT